MITFLNGILYDKNPASVVIEVNGIGYEVLISLSTFDNLPVEGKTCKLFIHEHIRDDAHILFGFYTEVERQIFRLLQNVSGIGPKIALGAISGMSIRELQACIVERDAKRLAKLPGIGKKTAERMIVELADKINPLEVLSADYVEAPLSSNFRDAIMALAALGHTHETATRAIRQIAQSPNPPETTEEIIKLALTPK